MAGRNKNFDESEVLEKAIEVFWKKGYEPSSTEELLASMGIGKGSFYNSFPGGKKELFEKALHKFSDSGLGKFRRHISASKNPLDELRNFFLSVATAEIEAHEKGCFLGNSIAELSITDSTLKEKAVFLLKRLEELFLEVLKEAKDKGKLKSKESPEMLAKYLINLWNGLSITRRMYRDKNTIKELIEMQLKILE